MKISKELQKVETEVLKHKANYEKAKTKTDRLGTMSRTTNAKYDEARAELGDVVAKFGLKIHLYSKEAMAELKRTRRKSVRLAVESNNALCDYNNALKKELSISRKYNEVKTERNCLLASFVEELEIY